MTFLARRLSSKEFTGLPLTVFLTATVYFVLLYVGTALGFAREGRIVQTDILISQFLAGFRSPTVIRFFSIVTAFGYWGVVMALAMAISALLWLNDRSGYLAGLWIALAGNQISVNVIKTAFVRARPQLAYYTEASFSFPSGHSALSAMFLGFAAYILIRERVIGILWPIFGAFCAIVLVGASRLVLGEHYLSDVLHGYLVGGLWACWAIWFVNHRSAISDVPQVTTLPRWRSFASFAVILTAMGAIWMLVPYYLAIQVMAAPITIVP